MLINILVDMNKQDKSQEQRDMSHSFISDMNNFFAELGNSFKYGKNIFSNFLW